MIRSAISTAILAAVSTGGLASTMEGSEVAMAVYCCTSPIESNRLSNIATATVGSSVEFPDGTFLSFVSGFSVIPLEVDIRASSIVFDYTVSALAAPGSFNGYVLAFWGAPAITSVSLNPNSTFIPSDFGFDADVIAVSVAGLSLSSSSLLILDLNLAPIPEPSSAVLMAVGALLLARRHRSSSKADASQVTPSK
jgi:hypothetical protein